MVHVRHEIGEDPFRIHDWQGDCHHLVLRLVEVVQKVAGMFPKNGFIRVDHVELRVTCGNRDDNVRVGRSGPGLFQGPIQAGYERYSRSRFLLFLLLLLGYRLCHDFI